MQVERVRDRFDRFLVAQAIHVDPGHSVLTNLPAEGTDIGHVLFVEILLVVGDEVNGARGGLGVQDEGSGRGADRGAALGRVLSLLGMSLHHWILTGMSRNHSETGHWTLE